MARPKKLRAKMADTLARLGLGAPMASPKTKAKPDEAEELFEQIEAARAAAEEFIDSEAARLKQLYPTIPVDALRMQLTARGFGSCSCKAAMSILDGK